MMLAKQSTAATLIIGPILDSTGAEYASAVIGDLSLSKNGATLTSLASAASLTYIANGQYTLVLTTGNTDTLGRSQISCNKATYQMPPLELMVIPSTVFDALVTNAVNATGGLAGATGAITAFAGAISTLTQTQVTGGAYALNSSSFAWNSGLDFTTTEKASITAAVPTAVQNRQEMDSNSVALAAIFARTDVATSTRQPTIWATVGSTVNLAGTTVNAVTTVGDVTGNVGGTITGDLAGNVRGRVLGQGATAFSGTGVQVDPVTLTAAYDAAKTAAQAGDAMTLDTTQVVPLANVTSDSTVTVGSALLSARAQGAGVWTLIGTALLLKNPDGTTFRSFTLDSATIPTSRT